MTEVIELKTEELIEQRRRLLDRVRMTWEQLADLAESYALDAEERNIYDSIVGINYLLADVE